MELDFAELTGSQLRENDFVNQVRRRVEQWRLEGAYTRHLHDAAPAGLLDRREPRQPDPVLPAGSCRNRDLPGRSSAPGWEMSGSGTSSLKRQAGQEGDALGLPAAYVWAASVSRSVLTLTKI
jgi:hypothetical protein